MVTLSPRLRVAVTADLHYGGRHADGTAAAHALAAELYHDPPDLFVLAGDIGAGDDFARCLDLFADLPGHKALVPGNHDIWVRPDDDRGDSEFVYRDHLPRVAADHDFHTLDAGPLVLPEAGLAVVGSMNWYDYSWGIDRLAAFGVPDWRGRLRTKRFLRGRHNDANFVRWRYDDAGFTRACVATLADHLRQALRQVPDAILVTHHPMARGLNYPKPDPPDLDAILWECFSGNDAAERLLAEFTDRVPLAVCGHTHFARDGVFGRTRGYNVGGDYHFKRLLRFDWPSCEATAEAFTASGERVA
ncbi:MAG: metallophosphoesterase [Gemmataceae bacterium]|nr:metallophosphoesterase [Gemmataceae bacterium]